MQITASQVKELRERSGAGMMECKKALTENNGNVDEAMEWLRKTGLAKADKKAGRIAAEGRIVLASSGTGAVLVEINSETDFVAKDENFMAFSEGVADVALKSGATSVEALKAAAMNGAVHGLATTTASTPVKKSPLRPPRRVSASPKPARLLPIWNTPDSDSPIASMM